VIENCDQLRGAIEREGFFWDCQGFEESADQMVLASHENAHGPRQRGLGGNSFWVLKVNNGWFIGTWSPIWYQVTQPARLLELCLQLLRRQPAKAYGRFEMAVMSEFALLEVPEPSVGDRSPP